MTSQLPLDLEPVRRKPSEKPRAVMIGTAKECAAFSREHWKDEEVRTCLWLLPGGTVPRMPLKVAFATPRDKLPAEMREALNKLERDGALEVWTW